MRARKAGPWVMQVLRNQLVSTSRSEADNAIGGGVIHALW